MGISQPTLASLQVFIPRTASVFSVVKCSDGVVCVCAASPSGCSMLEGQFSLTPSWNCA